MVWIGVHFPRLPLETLLRGSPSPEAWAVLESGRVLLADRKAAARGVRGGMPLAAALAIAPQLRTRSRDVAAETEALLGCAAWAAQFTPSVAIEFPDGLALEVSGSLKLFGGIETILTRLRDGLAELGFGIALAGAPTARAAAWLARTGQACIVAALESLPQALAPLPASLLRCGQSIPETLALVGVSTLGELLALPRAGVARRFGQDLLDQLDRALGALPDPRSFFTPPPCFHAAIELPAEVAQGQALLFAGQRLLAQLSGFLGARSAGVRRFAFRLYHREGAPTEICVGLVAPSRDAGHFALLLRERLANLALREPVRAVALEAGDVVPHAGSTRGLLPHHPPADAADWSQLIERLRARLGAQAVHSNAVDADHRPERAQRVVEPVAQRVVEPVAQRVVEPVAQRVVEPVAQRVVEPHAQRLVQTSPRPIVEGSGQLALDFGERPFWLLEAPRIIPEIDAVPHFHGPLTLLAGPERIETGWWDGFEVARDYFIARTPEDALLWVFRERGSGAQWYLHGIFS